MAANPKANLHALPELKNTSDDSIAPYLKSKGWKQNHTLTDVRLVLGFSAVIIAGGTFYYDYTLGFDKTKVMTLYAVIAYFVANTILTWWIWGMESGKVYVGSKDGVTITISSHTEKHSPIYHLKIVSRSPGQRPTTIEVESPFTSWFDTQGFLVEKPFMTFISNSIPSMAATTPEGQHLKSKTKPRSTKKA
ncbi:signal peptidase complex subunit 2 [Tuber indicum]|nr:signal peptidase complex subunit 2 [Tuber indicum]